MGNSIKKVTIFNKITIKKYDNTIIFYQTKPGYAYISPDKKKFVTIRPKYIGWFGEGPGSRIEPIVTIYDIDSGEHGEVNISTTTDVKDFIYPAKGVFGLISFDQDSSKIDINISTFDRRKITIDLETKKITIDLQNKQLVRDHIYGPQIECDGIIFKLFYFVCAFGGCSYGNSLANEVGIMNKSYGIIKVIKHSCPINRYQFLDTEHVFTESENGESKLTKVDLTIR